jgi:Tol biopolymer transport system component
MGLAASLVQVFLILGLLVSTVPAAAETLAFVRDGNIWVAGADGSGARQLTSGGQDEHPAVSPDGQWVAFQRSSETKAGFATQILRAPAAGGPAQPLTFQGVQEGWSPSFSRDGKQLIFAGCANRRTGKDGQTLATVFIALADLSTGGVRFIGAVPNHGLDAGYLYENPALSPDGRLIAYQESGSDVSGGWVIVDLSGKRLKSFPTDKEDYTPYWRPQFTRDGKEILCYSPITSEGQVNRIHLVDLATLKKREVVRGLKPTFVEQGKAIVFERYRKGEGLSTENVPQDLWYLPLGGGEPRKILENGHSPAGQ